MSSILDYTLSIGASLDLDLEPISNPPITSAKWFHGRFEPQTLGPWVEISEQVSAGAGALARLQLSRVGVEHMGSYKVTGINSIGSADLVFFLNVTRKIKLSYQNCEGLRTEGVKPIAAERITAAINLLSGKKLKMSLRA
ncbi:unnamed protein product [Hydatigera taeniaeformis]|uniref:Ig-like domain-containing protein n=1 Tax=Hydatigena taeniaeformis TaxID=6205 RepID=A0A0R3WQ65_HYDTA|nr:unnamed protein product [Hydatigera taeniaeformis]